MNFRDAVLEAESAQKSSAKAVQQHKFSLKIGAISNITTLQCTRSMKKFVLMSS